MLVESLEAGNHAIAEAAEAFSLEASQDPNEVCWQLERGCLKFQTFAWSISQHEAEIYVDQVTFFVE